MSPAVLTARPFLNEHSTPNRYCDRTVARGPRKGKLMTLFQIRHRPDSSGGNTHWLDRRNCVPGRCNRCDESYLPGQRQSHPGRTRIAFGPIGATVDRCGCTGQSERSPEFAFHSLRSRRHFASNRASQPVGQRSRSRPMREERSPEFLSRRWIPRSSSAGITPIHIGTERRSNSQFECLL